MNIANLSLYCPLTIASYHALGERAVGAEKQDSAHRIPSEVVRQLHALHGKLASTTEQALADLFWDVVAVESVSDHEMMLADLIEQFLLQYEHLEVLRHGDTIVARTHFGKSQRVILAGHIDTVPIIDNFPPQWLVPDTPAYSKLARPDVIASSYGTPILWGRGTADMKASDAVLLYLAATLTNPSYDITYVLYDHEEVAAEHNGLGKVAVEHPEWLQGDFAIIGEPTCCDIEGGCNGTMRFDVVAHGVAAHSARAWMGDNAIHKAEEILHRLNQYKPATIEVDGLPYREGLNATIVSGGTGTNVIPDECRIHVNYRFAPDKTLDEAKILMMGEGEYLLDIPNIATGGVFEGFEIVMKDESPAARPGMNNPLTQALQRLVTSVTGHDPQPKLGWTDVARFSQLGVPAVNLGAGNPLLAHKHDEQVALHDLLQMESLLRQWLSA